MHTILSVQRKKVMNIEILENDTRNLTTCVYLVKYK